MTDDTVSLALGGYVFHVPLSTVNAGASAVAAYVREYTMFEYDPPFSEVQQALDAWSLSSAAAASSTPAVEAPASEDSESPVAADESPASVAPDAVEESLSAPASAETSAPAAASSAAYAPHIIEVPAPYFIYMNDGSNSSTVQPSLQADSFESTLSNTEQPVVSLDAAAATPAADDLPADSSESDVLDSLLGDDDVSEQIVTVLSDIREDLDFMLEGRPFLTTQFSDYSVTEGLLLTIALLTIGKACLGMIHRGFSWLM